MAFSIQRFLKFFRTSPVRRAEPPASPDPSGQRAYERYPIAFEVIVTRTGPVHENVSERCALKNVSGGGAMFISRFPKRYAPGQRLALDIFLAGTPDVRASFKTEATVVRLHDPLKHQKHTDCAETGVAVQFHQPFEFTRMDSFLGGGS